MAQQYLPCEAVMQIFFTGDCHYVVVVPVLSRLQTKLLQLYHLLNNSHVYVNKLIYIYM